MYKAGLYGGSAGAAGRRRDSAGAGCDGAPAVLLDVDEKLLQSRRAARRSALGIANLDVLDAWSDWMEEQFPDGATFVTLTYSDENGAKRSAYSPKSCFRDARSWRSDLKLPRPFVHVTEPHRWRDILHLHGLAVPMSEADRKLAAAYWEADRGFARLLPATAGAFPYVVKYAFKSAPGAGHDCLDLSGLVKGERVVNGVL